MAKTKIYKLTPTLNNLSYKVIINDTSKEVQVVLPCSTLPDRLDIVKQQKNSKKKEDVVICSADPVRICVLFVNTTEGKPNVTVTSNSPESKISGQVNLKPKACQIFEFYSANGGLNWFVDALGKQDDETTVNGKLGPNITIDASDIKVLADDPDSITIKEKLDELSIVKIAGPDTIGGIMVSELGDIDVDSNGVVTIKDKAITKSKLADDVQNKIDNAATKSELTDVKTDVSNIHNTIDTINTSIDDINKEIETLHTDVEGVQTNLDNAIKDINDNLPKNVMNIIADNVDDIIVESFSV